MNHVETGSEASLTSLVTGIVTDAQELMKQQLALLKSEVRQDLQRTRDAAVAMAAGVGVAAVGGLLVCLALVHFLSWALPDLPLWGSYAIVGGLFIAIGAAMLFAGKKKLESFNPLPDQTAHALKENAQWLMNQNPK